jgi:hypothetical protein
MMIFFYRILDNTHKKTRSACSALLVLFIPLLSAVPAQNSVGAIRDEDEIYMLRLKRFLFLRGAACLPPQRE